MAEPDQVYPDATTERRSFLLRRHAGEDDAAQRPGAPPAVGLTAAGAPVAAVSFGPGDQAAAEPEERVGICLSGGGIRAASFGLGALQQLQKAGLLRGPKRARYLSAVSGGSYITGAVTLAAVGALPGEEGGERVVAAPDPFAPGSPEEGYLRNHTTYLTHGPGGSIAFVWRLLMGITINVAFLGLAMHSIARPLGWAYGWHYRTLRQGWRCTTPGCDLNVRVPVPDAVYLALGVCVAGSVAFGLLYVGVRWARDRTGFDLAKISAGFMALAAVVLVFGAGVPQALELLREATGARTGGGEAAQASGTVGAYGSGGLIGIVVATAVAVRSWLSGPTGKVTTSWVGRHARTMIEKLRMPLLNLVAAISGPVFLVALFLAFVNWGASRPPGAEFGGGSGEVVLWAGLIGVLLVMYRFADLVAWSLHPIYKRRLASAFALRRVQPSPATPSGPAPAQTAEERPYATLYRLSQSQPEDFPEVLICAAANVSDWGRVPTGANVTSFVFSAREIGGPAVGSIPTTQLEEAVGSRGRDITLPAAVSIAGAAFSPSMGKMTRGPVRFLLAFTNLRLGVWVPNPKRVQEFRIRKDRKVYPNSPRPTYLLRELFGRNHIESPFLYVTDGGHYENLGLVELLRRRCTEIWCVDASGDDIDTFNTLSEALLIARGELQIEVDLDPTVMAPDPTIARDPARAHYVRETHAIGTIRYPDGTRGTLIVVKAGVPKDAPFDVLAFHLRHPQFPCDSTINQLYTAERFDAYHALGSVAMERALVACGRLVRDEPIDLRPAATADNEPAEPLEGVHLP